MKEAKKLYAGNSEGSLLAIYVLRVLKEYSSPEKPMTCDEVIKHLRDGGEIDLPDESDNELCRGQKKKFTRILDTLHDFYGRGCVGKIEGKNNRESHKWFYDGAKDKSAREKSGHESLSEAELDLLIDVISSCKIINSESTAGMIEKLLKKTKLPKAEREKRLRTLKCEAWSKSLNDELVARKAILDDAIEKWCDVRFDYGEQKGIEATPYKLTFKNGKYSLIAKSGDRYLSFSFDKLRRVEKMGFAENWDDAFEAQVMDGKFDFDESNPDCKTVLESLFVNMPIVKSAIKEKRVLVFQYLTYTVVNENIALVGRETRALPHSLVFNDGKYYLIGIDVTKEDVGFFRVDMMSGVRYGTEKLTLSDWNEAVYERMERARVVENHPLMMAGQEIPVTFTILKTALGRVVDAFGASVKFWPVEDESCVKFTVRTTREEAFRWALANADAVELVGPQDIRDKLRRISEPIYTVYQNTLADKVQENLDRVLKCGDFNIGRAQKVDEKVAHATYLELKKREKTDDVQQIVVGSYSADDKEYLSCFSSAQYLRIEFSSSKDLKWASNLTKLIDVQIRNTPIEGVSWLENLKELKRVMISDSPVCDLSVLRDHEHITHLNISETEVRDIGFIEKYENLGYLNISGCPIEDYSVLLKIRPLVTLVIDEKAVEALGMDKLKEHHSVTDILVKQAVYGRQRTSDDPDYEPNTK